MSDQEPDPAHSPTPPAPGTRPRTPWRGYSRTRRVLAGLGVLAVTVLGAGLGVALAPGTSTYLGPLQTEVSVRPSLHPGARLDLPPAGQVSFDTHRAPVMVTARITSVDLNAASRLVRSPAQILTLETTAADTMSAAVLRAGAYAAGCSLLGAGSAGFLLYRGWRRTAQTSTACLVAGAMPPRAPCLTAQTGAMGLSPPRTHPWSFWLLPLPGRYVQATVASGLAAPTCTHGLLCRLGIAAVSE